MHTSPADQSFDSLPSNLKEVIDGLFPKSDIQLAQAAADGLSGAPVYKILIDAVPYLLKIANPEADLNFNARYQASESGIAPKLIYGNKENGISISQWIDAVPLPSLEAHRELVAQLADCVQKIHSIKTAAPAVNIFDKVDELLNWFNSSAVLGGPVIEACLDRYSKIKNVFPFQTEDLVFCHNDLNPANILFEEGRIWIIDWEAAASGNRYVDLASICNFFIHTEAQQRTFLDFYFNGNLSEANLSKLYLMRQVSRLLYALLMFKLAGQQKAVGYKHDANMEGITMELFGMKLRSGEISLSDYSGQFLLGKALISQVFEHTAANRLDAAIKELS